MNDFLRKIKHYIWWYVFATDKEKEFYSLSLFGKVWKEVKTAKGIKYPKVKILNPHRIFK